MHDYPSVPSVFRVSSSHSINNDANYGNNIRVADEGGKSTNSNASKKPSNSISHAVSSAVSSNVIMAAAHKQEYIEPRRSQQQQPSYNHELYAGTSYMSHNVHPSHRLTTTASIERNCFLSDIKQRQEQLHSPYGTINTISGSIPATGFSNGAVSASGGSDLNINMNNSIVDLKDIRDSRRKQFAPTNAQSEHSSYRPLCNAYGSTKRQDTGYLWFLTPVAASISVAIVIAALAGPHWLYTEEKLPNSNYNGTANFNAMDDGAYITKYTRSSLWILCTTLQDMDTYNCIKIDYFPKEGYRPDPVDSTPAIPYTVTKSCPIFLASGVFLVISFIVFLIPTCSQQNSLYYFSAGIMFIVSGLLMLIGVIAYISILKAEIGSKLRPRSSLQPPLFKVIYGQSFYLFVSGFITTEFVGLLNIFLYISLQEVGYYRRLPCLTIASLRDKIKDVDGQINNTYKSYTHQTERLSLNQFQPQLHTEARAAAALVDFDRNKVLQQQDVNGFTCRKHPNISEAYSFAPSELEQRYYFEKQPLKKCNLHSKDLTKSLNELYTEPAPPIAPPSPPALSIDHLIGYRRSETFPRSPQPPPQFADLPQEFPLTRSVSTTTDIFGHNSQQICVNNNFRTTTTTRTPHMERKSQRNMATNTSTNDIEPSERNIKNDGNKRAIDPRNNKNYLDNYDDEPQRLCGLKRGTRKSKDELFQEICKRAGMRPKPKNIYYIANEEDEMTVKEDQQRHESRSRRQGSTLKNGGIQNLDDEDGFQRVQDNEEHIYVREDNQHVPFNSRLNNRRSSMYVEPLHLRRLNSNLSLHAPYPLEKAYQKNLQALEQCDLPIEMWPTYPEGVYARGAYGGSQNRLCQDSSLQIFQNRTLPRSFLKSNTNSQDSLGSVSFHASASALHNLYSASQSRLQAMMLQQRQQQNHLRPLSRESGIYQSSPMFHKSCENISPAYPQPQFNSNAVYAQIGRRPLPSTNDTGNVSGNNQTTTSNRLQPPTTIHWPTAIPSSPSNYTANLSIYAPPPVAFQGPSITHNLVTRSASGGAGNTNGPAKFKRGYAFDEQRRSSTTGEGFDLDEIERERRRSHASLFSGISSLAINGGMNSSTEQYDMINGTAV